MKITPQQIIETQKEIKNMINSGQKFICLAEYEHILSTFGLKLCKDEGNYLKLYFNNLNEQGFLHASTSALDIIGESFANINGCFYKKEIENETKVYLAFKEFRNMYFTIYDDNFILGI